MPAAVRKRLPNRREHEVFEFSHEGHDYIVGLGRNDIGQLAEVFLNASKAGTAIETQARDGAIILSIALQHGVQINDLRNTMTRNSDGSASGPLGKLLDLLA
jgi:hypothetical protein